MLTIDEKLEILKSRTSRTITSEKFGIGISTVPDIKKNTLKLKVFKKKMVDMGFTTRSSIKHSIYGSDSKESSAYL